MKRKNYNYKSLFLAAIPLVVGIILCVIGACRETEIWENVWISVGCSLIASAGITISHDLWMAPVVPDPIEEWKVDKICERSKMNDEMDYDRVEHCIDGIAFGLSSLREQRADVIENALKRGVNVRILTMNPDSQFTLARDKEENDVAKSTKTSIHKLVEWADSLNRKNYPGKFLVKGYSCMTLDFYWRLDDTVYVGPYWYGRKSQGTITYKFLSKGKGAETYNKYFFDLWNNSNLTKLLTQEK